MQRVSSEDRKTPFCRQAVNQSAEIRYALEFFATAQSCRERQFQSTVLSLAVWPELAQLHKGRLHSAHTGSMLPTTLWGKSPCEVAESVIRRLQNTSSWTGSEAECRDAVCLACSQRRCGESPRAKLQRVSSEDRRTPVCGQAVKQSAVMRSALEFFATTQSCRERGGALISSWRPGA